MLTHTASQLLTACCALQSCLGTGVGCPFLLLLGTAGRMEPPGYGVTPKGRDGCPSRDGMHMGQARQCGRFVPVLEG